VHNKLYYQCTRRLEAFYYNTEVSIYTQIKTVVFYYYFIVLFEISWITFYNFSKISGERPFISWLVHLYVDNMNPWTSLAVILSFSHTKFYLFDSSISGSGSCTDKKLRGNFPRQLENLKGNGCIILYEESFFLDEKLCERLVILHCTYMRK